MYYFQFSFLLSGCRHPQSFRIGLHELKLPVISLGFYFGVKLVCNCCFCLYAVKGIEVYLKRSFYFGTALGGFLPYEAIFSPPFNEGLRLEKSNLFIF